MSAWSRRLTALAACGVMALTAAACGAEDAPEVLDPVATSGAGGAEDGATTGAAERPATPEPGTEVAPADFMARLKSPGEDRLGSFTLDMSMTGEQAGGFSLSGAADLRGETPQMNLTMTVPGTGEVDVLMVGGEVFLAIPGMTQEGQYMRVDPAELGLDLGEVTGSVDLERTFDAWDEGTQSVTFVGTEEVDGEELDRYTLAVDAGAASEAMGETMAPDLPETVSYDVWLDADSLMRQVVFEIEGVGVQMQVDNWGEDVDIQAPEESQIVDFSF